jgi:hypothetical protein
VVAGLKVMAKPSQALSDTAITVPVVIASRFGQIPGARVAG